MNPSTPPLSYQIPQDSPFHRTLSSITHNPPRQPSRRFFSRTLPRGAPNVDGANWKTLNGMEYLVKTPHTHNRNQKFPHRPEPGDPNFPPPPLQSRFCKGGGDAFLNPPGYGFGGFLIEERNRSVCSVCGGEGNFFFGFVGKLVGLIVGEEKSHHVACLPLNSMRKKKGFVMGVK